MQISTHWGQPREIFIRMAQLCVGQARDRELSQLVVLYLSPVITADSCFWRISLHPPKKAPTRLSGPISQLAFKLGLQWVWNKEVRGAWGVMARWRAWFNPRKSFPPRTGIALNIGGLGVKHTVTTWDTRFNRCSGHAVHGERTDASTAWHYFSHFHCIFPSFRDSFEGIPFVSCLPLKTSILQLAFVFCFITHVQRWPDIGWYSILVCTVHTSVDVH